MAKTVNEVLTSIKGEGNVDKTITGKGTASKKKFADFTNAYVNDASVTVSSVDKDGNSVETNISELIRADLKKTYINAGCPQKPEIDVLDKADISTDGISTAIGHIVMNYLRTGNKLDLPAQSDTTASLYMAPLPGKEKNVTIRDMKTQEVTGSVDITTKDSIQVKCQSRIPKNLVTKVRKDVSGNVVK